jgi:hypothetical protein
MEKSGVVEVNNIILGGRVGVYMPLALAFLSIPHFDEFASQCIVEQRPGTSPLPY